MASHRRLFVIALPIVGLAVTTWLVFGSISTANFVGMDDPGFVAQNPWLNPPGWTNLATAWRQPKQDLYVPMVYVAWSAVAAGEQRPPGATLIAGPFHWFNLGVHFLAAVAVFLLLIQFFRPAPAWAGAMLFLIHPLQAETVGWVSSAKDLMCGAFSVLALWQYVIFARSTSKFRSRASFAAATVLFAMALLSKPSAAVVPLIAAVIDRFLLNRPLRSFLKPLSTWIVMAACTAVAARVFQVGQPSHPPGVWERPWIAVGAIGFYAIKLIAPFNLTIDYEHTPQWIMAHPGAVMPGVIVLLAAACTYFRERNRWILIGPLISVMALLPVLGLTLFDYEDYSVVADHYVYLPMFGMAMLLAAAMDRGGGLISWTLVGALLLTLSIRAQDQIDNWQNTESLVHRQLAYDPDGSTGHRLWGAWLLATGNPDGALKEMKLTEAAYDREGKEGTPEFWLSYGNVLWSHGDAPRAISAYQKAIEQLPPEQRPDAMDNLGIAYALTGDRDSARKEFEESLKLRPDDETARRDLEKLGKN